MPPPDPGQPCSRQHVDAARCLGREALEGCDEAGRLARIDATVYQHINPYGRFTLDLTQRIPLSLTKIA